MDTGVSTSLGSASIGTGSGSTFLSSMSTGKKVLIAFIVLALVAGAATGIYFLVESHSTPNKHTDHRPGNSGGTGHKFPSGPDTRKIKSDKHFLHSGTTTYPLQSGTETINFNLIGAGGGGGGGSGGGGGGAPYRGYYEKRTILGQDYWVLVYAASSGSGSGGGAGGAGDQGERKSGTWNLADYPTATQVRVTVGKGGEPGSKGTLGTGGVWQAVADNKTGADKGNDGTKGTNGSNGGTTSIALLDAESKVLVSASASGGNGGEAGEQGRGGFPAKGSDAGAGGAGAAGGAGYPSGQSTHGGGGGSGAGQWFYPFVGNAPTGTGPATTGASSNGAARGADPSGGKNYSAAAPPKTGKPGPSDISGLDWQPPVPTATMKNANGGSTSVTQSGQGGWGGQAGLGGSGAVIHGPLVPSSTAFNGTDFVTAPSGTDGTDGGSGGDGGVYISATVVVSD